MESYQCKQAEFNLTLSELITFLLTRSLIFLGKILSRLCLNSGRIVFLISTGEPDYVDDKVNIFGILGNDNSAY